MKATIWFGLMGAALFGVSHWLFVINYLTLAMRIKYSEQDFEPIFKRLNLIYYTFAALNFIVPIVCAAVNNSITLATCF